MSAREGTRGRGRVELVRGEEGADEVPGLGVRALELGEGRLDGLADGRGVAERGRGEVRVLREEHERVGHVRRHVVGEGDDGGG